MTQRIYRYSIIWRVILTATVPLIYFLIMAYNHNAGDYYLMYLNMGVTVIALVPYFFLLMKFSEAYLVGERYITQKNMLTQRTLA